MCQSAARKTRGISHEVVRLAASDAAQSENGPPKRQGTDMGSVFTRRPVGGRDAQLGTLAAQRKRRRSG